MKRFLRFLLLCVVMVSLVMPLAAIAEKEEEPWVTTPESQVLESEAAAPETGPSLLIILPSGSFSLRVLPGVASMGTGSADRIPDSLYIPLEDKGTERFLKAIGAFASWSGKGDILFISSSGRDIFFGSDSSRAKFKELHLSAPRGYLRKDGVTWLPMADFAGYLGLNVVSFSSDGTGQASARLVPSLDEVSVKEDDGARKLLLHTSVPVKYSVLAEDLSQVTILFPATRFTASGYQEAIGDFTVIPETLPGGVKVTVKFPKHWDGRLLSRAASGDLTLELMPAFPLSAGYKAETIEKAVFEPGAGEASFRISASGPLQYFWRYFPERRMLLVDFPLITAKASLPASEDRAFIRQSSLSSYSTGYGTSRLALSLAQDVTFAIEADEEDPYMVRVRLRRAAAPGPSALEGKGCTSAPEVCGTIVIDPGHGGCDPGACNGAMGLKEKDLTLDMARTLAAVLEEKGWKVILTRSSDRDVTWAYSPDRLELQARSDVGNVNGADAFISIHCNASTSSALHGSSIHWCKEADYALAKSLGGILGPALGLKDRGLCRDTFYVINHARMPAVLVETAFMSNSADAQKLADRSFRELVAKALAQALDEFMGTRFARKAKRNAISGIRHDGAGGSEGAAREKR
ncbi:MAG: N-acetylmuramoyl-L-alanine amidase [Candidatus Eremiobacteraeota bacterium]|nr:N-acetylmuramoyl-L-alanine amidase [Candidatus Eremiobacteraeota bacterium]